MIDQQVTVRGIVTASWQTDEELSGFFIHSFAEDMDDNPTTSEGLFAVTEKHHSRVDVGEQVQLTGKVEERSQLTSLVDISSITTCGHAESLPTITDLKLPVQSLTELEALEGMPVKLSASSANELTISGHYNYPRHGYFDVSSGRLWTPTQIVMPGQDAKRQAEENQLNRLQVDDNSNVIEPSPLPFSNLWHGKQNSLRSGATITSFSGIVSQFNNAYRIQPTEDLTLESSSEQPQLPKKTNDSVRIASFNVLNFFNGNGSGQGFPTPRGADNTEQMKRQLQKIVAALTALDADVVGLMEIENDGFGEHSAILQLVNALEKASGKEYEVAEPGLKKLVLIKLPLVLFINPNG